MNYTVLPLVAILLFLSACQHVDDSKVRALLDETESEYRIIKCSSAIVERKMYCDIQIGKNEVENFVKSLGLGMSPPFAKDLNRVIYLSKGIEFDNKEIEKKVGISFVRQLWIPTRHGFAGGFLIYDLEDEQGRLWLSIAYG